MKFATFCLTILVLALGLSALGDRVWFFDLFSHFTLQYAIAALVLMSFFNFKKSRRQLYVAGACFVYAGILLANVIDHRGPMVRIGDEKARVRIFSFNAGGKDAILRNWLPVHASQYDVVVLLEASNDFADFLEQMKGPFPYQVTHLENSPFGIAILSRWEITDTQAFQAEALYPQYQLRIKMPTEDEFLIYALHTPPPFAPQLAEAHEVILGELRQRLNEKKYPAVVVGDLNTTSYSKRFNALLSKTGLRDTTGLSPWSHTWPSALVNIWSLLGIRIDQCLISNSFSIVERESLEDLGSDHLPVKCVVQIEK